MPDTYTFREHEPDRDERPRCRECDDAGCPACDAEIRDQKGREREEGRRRWAYIEEEGERRRVLIVMHLGFPGFVVRWTADCSGCTDYGDYGTRYGPFGCEECGYSGKRRRREWVPLPGYEGAYFREIDRRWKRKRRERRRVHD